MKTFLQKRRRFTDFLSLLAVAFFTHENVVVNRVFAYLVFFGFLEVLPALFCRCAMSAARQICLLKKKQIFFPPSTYKFFRLGIFFPLEA